jgi:hypothetical protein
MELKPAAAMFLLAVGFTGIGLASEPSSKQAYACQFTKDAGLDWKNGAWNVTQFVPQDPFILVVEDGILTDESAAGALSSSGSSIECSRDPLSRQSCTDGFGGFLNFSEDDLSGGVAQLTGAMQPATAAKKDSVTVATFSCQKF